MYKIVCQCIVYSAIVRLQTKNKKKNFLLIKLFIYVCDVFWQFEFQFYGKFCTFKILSPYQLYRKMFRLMLHLSLVFPQQLQRLNQFDSNPNKCLSSALNPSGKSKYFYSFILSPKCTKIQFKWIMRLIHNGKQGKYM